MATQKMYRLVGDSCSEGELSLQMGWRGGDV
jgi:hypothetical protein